MSQGVYSGFGFEAGIDQFLAQGADNAVAAGVELAHFRAICAYRFNDATGTGVDHCGNPARLGVKGIFLGHGDFLGAVLEKAA